MQVRTRVDDELGILMIGLHGRLTRRSARSLERVLATAVAEGQRRILVDLRDLSDVDPGLALVLLEADDELADLGGWLWLVHGAGHPGSSLRFMGVHDRVRSMPTPEAAGWPTG